VPVRRVGAVSVISGNFVANQTLAAARCNCNTQDYQAATRAFCQRLAIGDDCLLLTRLLKSLIEWRSGTQFKMKQERKAVTQWSIFDWKHSKNSGTFKPCSPLSLDINEGEIWYGLLWPVLASGKTRCAYYCWIRRRRTQGERVIHILATRDVVTTCTVRWRSSRRFVIPKKTRTRDIFRHWRFPLIHRGPYLAAGRQSCLVKNHGLKRSHVRYNT